VVYFFSWYAVHQSAALIAFIHVPFFGGPSHAMGYWLLAQAVFW
jgi:hypothetical protein